MASGTDQNLTERILASTTENFKWPDAERVTLYHLPSDQELLSDAARRLCFQTYLSLSKLPFTMKAARNTNSMSPEGTSPFIVLQLGCEPLILCNFEKTVDFLEANHLGIGSKLEHADKLDQEAHISLLRTKIMPAQTWANRKNLREMVKISGHGFSWPLSVVLPCLFHLHYIWDQWSTFMKPREEILRDFEQVCSSLSQRLGNQDSFFPFRLTTLDVVVYSHLQAILSTRLLSKELRQIIVQFENLTKFCQHIAKLPELNTTPTQKFLEIHPLNNYFPFQ